MSEPPARIVHSILFAYIGFQLIRVPDFIHSGPNEAGFNWRIKSDLSWDKQRTHKHSEASYEGTNTGSLGTLRIAQDSWLACLSVFELSIRAQMLAMWPLTSAAQREGYANSRRSF